MLVVRQARPRLAFEADDHGAILIIAADLPAGEAVTAMQSVRVTEKSETDKIVADSAAPAMSADVTAGPVIDWRRRYDRCFGRKARAWGLICCVRRLRGGDDDERPSRKQKLFHFPQPLFTSSARHEKERSAPLSRRRFLLFLRFFENAHPPALRKTQGL